MQRNVSSTVVAVVGGDETSIERLDAPNVRTLDVEADDEPLARAVATWREATRTHRPYVVHDADPLAAVADAWVALYDGQGARGEFELAVEGLLGTWRRRQVDLPDYYLVVDPDGLPSTRRHWYLGMLLGAAPHRVVPVDGSPSAMLTAVRRLRAGRWWPDLDRLLADVAEVAPDRFEPAADDDAPGLALIES